MHRNFWWGVLAILLFLLTISPLIVVLLAWAANPKG